MVSVPPVPREVIDKWRISEAGLSRRIVTSSTAAGFETVGQLRALPDRELLAITNFGRACLKEVKRFFALCERIEQGKQSFPHVLTVLELFLEPILLEVVTGRYGLLRMEPTVSRQSVTLEKLAVAHGLTRERIRQLEERALQKLSSKIVEACLSPFVDLVVACVETPDRVTAASDLASLQGNPVWAGCNVASLALLFADLYPARLSYRNGVFSTYAEAALRRIEEVIVHELVQAGSVCTAEELIQRTLAALETEGLSVTPRAVMLIASHTPQLNTTTDGRFFIEPEGTLRVLVEILRELGTPSNYRRITELFNLKVAPSNRKGVGTVLRLLRSAPSFTQVARGVYALREST